MVKVAAGLRGLTAVGALAVAATNSGEGSALADDGDKSQFVDITKLKPNVKAPRPENGATTGTFMVNCGRDESGHLNPDNFIAQPGVRTQIDEANKRLAKNENPRDANFNQNAIVGPLKDKRAATINRMAIAIGRNAQKPQGLEKLAPCKLAGGGGEALEDIDSKNHRDHIVFPDQNGKCKNGFEAVPQLRISLTYNIPRNIQQAGQCAVDSFPEEEHNPRLRPRRLRERHVTADHEPARQLREHRQEVQGVVAHSTVERVESVEAHRFLTPRLDDLNTSCQLR